MCVNLVNIDSSGTEKSYKWNVVAELVEASTEKVNENVASTGSVSNEDFG